MKASEPDESKPEGQQDVNDDYEDEDEETHPQEMRAKEILRLTSPTVSVGIPSTIDSDQQRYSENQALITDSRGRVPSEKQNVMRETDTLDTIDGVTVGATRVRGPSYRYTGQLKSGRGTICDFVGHYPGISDVYIRAYDHTQCVRR